MDIGKGRYRHDKYGDENKNDRTVDYRQCPGYPKVRPVCIVVLQNDDKYNVPLHPDYFRVDNR
jgi:hypothetical protein